MSIERFFYNAPEEKIQKIEEEMSTSDTVEQPPVLPTGHNTVELMGKENFDRMQSLGKTIAARGELSDAEKEEYRKLSNKFVTTVEVNQRIIIENLKNPGTTASVGMDNGSSDRFRSLDAIKEIVGSLAVGHDDSEKKDYASLSAKFGTLYRNALLIDANTPPAPIMFESPIEIFDEADVSKWSGGTEKFKRFIQKIQEQSLRNGYEAVFDPSDENALKALFLGEKPIVLTNTSLISSHPQLIDLLKSSGLRVAGNYIYDEGQVRNIIEKNKELFTKSFGTDNPNMVMEYLGRNKAVVTDHVAVGLLLGYPLESVKKFEYFKTHRVEDGARPPQRRLINIYGINWADFDDSMESKIKQARFKAAFETSGILNVQ